jgi:hypothetical protein
LDRKHLGTVSALRSTLFEWRKTVMMKAPPKYERAFPARVPFFTAARGATTISCVNEFFVGMLANRLAGNTLGVAETVAACRAAIAEFKTKKPSATDNMMHGICDRLLKALLPTEGTFVFDVMEELKKV